MIHFNYITGSSSHIGDGDETAGDVSSSSDEALPPTGPVRHHVFVDDHGE